MAAALNVATECVAVSGQLVAVPDNPGFGVFRPENSAASAPPWNEAAAAAHYGLTETARRLETSLLNQLEGERPRPRRGGATSSTYAALRAIGRLAQRLERGDAALVITILLRRAAETQRLAAVDTLTRWVRIRPDPRPVFCPRCETRHRRRPPLCPYCRTYSLRRAEGSYTVMCFGWRRIEVDGELRDEPCTDSGGNRPKAHLDVSHINSETVLAFDDGLVMGAASECPAPRI